MPITESQLAQSRAKVESAYKEHEKYAGAGSELVNRIRDRLRQRAAERGTGMLEKQASELRKEYVAAPAEMRESYVGVDPYQRLNLMTQRRAGIMGQLSGVTDQIDARKQRVTDIIEMAKRGIEAEGERAFAAAQGAQTSYQNMFGEFELAERARQADQQAQIAREQMANTRAIAEARWEKEKEAEEAEMEQEWSATINDEITNIAKIDELIRELKSGEVKTGPTKKLQTWLGGIVDVPGGQEHGQVVDFRTRLGKITAESMFEVGGKALTESEKEILREYVPEFTDRTIDNIKALENYRSDLVQKYNELNMREYGRIYGFEDDGFISDSSTFEFGSSGENIGVGITEPRF